MNCSQAIEREEQVRPLSKRPAEQRLKLDSFAEKSTKKSRRKMPRKNNRKGKGKLYGLKWGGRRRCFPVPLFDSFKIHARAAVWKVMTRSGEGRRQSRCPSVVRSSCYDEICLWVLPYACNDISFPEIFQEFSLTSTMSCKYLSSMRQLMCSVENKAHPRANLPWLTLKITFHTLYVCRRGK